MSDSTVSSVFLRVLKKHGIRYVFGIPTIQIGMMQDGFGRDPFFKFFTTRHEESVAHMAHGIAKTTHEMAACFGTVGPGVTNMVPGVAAATRDHLPMLAITSNNHLRLIEPGKDYLQTIDQLSLFAPIAKWGAGLRQAERTVEVVERAIYKSRFGSPGPVQVDVPFDLHTAGCNVDPYATPLLPVPRPIPSARELETVVEAMLKASRPLLVAGGGIPRSGATEQFRELVKRTGFAAATTINGYGVLSKDCPTEVGSRGFFGGYGLVKACREADLIISVGCRYSLWMPVNKPHYPPVVGQKIIQIDIDSDQLGVIAPAELGLVGDARETIKALLDVIGKKQFDTDRTWLAELIKERNRYYEDIARIADDVYLPGTKTLNEAAIARAVVSQLPEDAIVTIDGGQSMEWSLTWFRPVDPHHFMYNPGMGHLGSGLPAAIAAKIANPGATVVCMTGDGAFGMTIQELETARRYGVPIIVIVYNDSAWGMYERPNRAIFHNENFGTRMSVSDYATIARGFGCEGVRVGSIEELSTAVRAARERNTVTVIDVATGYTPHPMDEIWRPVNTEGARLRQVEITT